MSLRWLKRGILTIEWLRWFGDFGHWRRDWHLCVDLIGVSPVHFSRWQAVEVLRLVKEAELAQHAETCLAQGFDFAPFSFSVMGSFGHRSWGDPHPSMSVICLPCPYPAMGGPSVVFCSHAWHSWAIYSSSVIWLKLVIDCLSVFLGCHYYC